MTETAVDPALEEALWDARMTAEPAAGEGSDHSPSSGGAEALRSRLLSRAQLRDLPKPEPLIVDTLDLRSVTLLVGHRSTAKTFLALDWSCSVATGRPWQGRPSRRGRVLYVAAEGAYGLSPRIDAWEDAWQHETADLDVLPAPVNLLDLSEVTDLAAVAAGYTLVTIDTLARCARAADENSARDMGLVIDAAYRIRGAGARSVLLVHHTGKDRGTTRGSSALEAGVDTVYLSEGDPRCLTLTRTKRRDGPEDDRHTLRLSPAAESCFIESQGGGQDHELRDRERRLLSTFVSTFSETGASKAELRAAAEMPSPTFHRALNDLLKRGALVDIGTKARPSYRLGEAVAET